VLVWEFRFAFVNDIIFHGEEQQEYKDFATRKRASCWLQLFLFIIYNFLQNLLKPSNRRNFSNKREQKGKGLESSRKLTPFDFLFEVPGKILTSGLVCYKHDSPISFPFLGFLVLVPL
jgi:hypothetical protein